MPRPARRESSRPRHRVIDEFPRPPALNVLDTETNQGDCGHMDFKLELVLLPVSDVDRAKTFYAD
jgi:hypothetical protein